MPAITKFIIALDPAAPCYALSFDVSPSDIFRNTAATRAVATPDRTKAHQFDTFEEARKVSKDITGWGGAQRVEEIAVQVAEPRDLDGSDLNIDTNRIETRDAATFAWHEAVDAGKDTVAERIDHVLASMRDLGFGADRVNDWTCAADIITIADPHGNWLTLSFDPRQDGFDYPASVADAEAIEARLDAEANLGEGEESEPADAADSGDDACDPLAEMWREEEPICAGCDGLFPLREGQHECETCAAARSIVNPVTAAVIAATGELYDYMELAEAEAERQPILDEDAVTDLLTNLRHAAAADGIDFDELVAISARHFAAEVDAQAKMASLTAKIIAPAQRGDDNG